MICRFCGKNINSLRFCGICGKQNPIILKWNNYEECDEIKEVSDYLKSIPLPYANKYRENIDRKSEAEKKEEIKPIENKPQNSNKIENVIPKLNDNISREKVYSNKNNQKKSNNLWKRKYLILSVFVGIVVLAVGTVAAISLNSNKNDKDRNDKSEVDSESIDTSDVEKSTSVNLENSSDKESTETSESETESNNESTETSSTETNEEANKTKIDIDGTYYSVPDIYKNIFYGEDKFKIFNKKNNLYLNRFVKLNKNKLTYHKGDNSNFDVNYSNNGDYITLYKTLSEIGQEESNSVEESNSIEESNSVDDKEYGDFISYFKFNEFVGNETYEDKSSEDSNLYFFKLKDKNINVTLMCNKLGDNSDDNSENNLKFDDRNDTEESTDKYEATTSETETVETTTKNKSKSPRNIFKKDKKTKSQDTSEETTIENETEEPTETEKPTEKFVFDIIDGEGNHIECDKDVDNNFTISPYYGIKGDPKGDGEVLRDHYIGKYMIARLEIDGKNWFLLRDYNDKSSVYVVQYIKYND